MQGREEQLQVRRGSQSDEEDTSSSWMNPLEEYKKKVKPSWIGQRILIEMEEGNKMGARIKDYFLESGQSQIWFDSDNKQIDFEMVKLEHLTRWSVPDTYTIGQYPELAKYSCTISKIID